VAYFEVQSRPLDEEGEITQKLSNGNCCAHRQSNRISSK